MSRLSKSLLAGSVAMIAALSTAPTRAADLPVKAPAAAMAAPFTWTGFYLGINGGGGTAKFDRVGVYDSNPVKDSHNNTGYFIGGQLGYNWQFSPSWVFGIEADFQGSNFHDSFTCGAGPASGGSCYDSTSDAGFGIDNFGTVRGRLGFAMANWLIYGTGGYAWGRVRYDANDYLPNNTGTTKITQSGWVAGAGIEYAIARNWSVKAEYLHIDLGSKTHDPIPSSTPDYIVNINATMDIGRFGVNYRF